jgi:hypothetical protein
MAIKIGRRNQERETRIYPLWKQGYKIKKIHEITGYPVSSVGYYTKKFKEKGNSFLFTGSSDNKKTINPLPLNRVAQIFGDPRFDPKKQQRPHTPQDSLDSNTPATSVVVRETHEIWARTMKALVSNKQYDEARKICELILLLPQVDKQFDVAQKHRSKVWPNNAYMIITSIFLPDKR